MYLLRNPFHEPAFNLALEEYLLTKTELNIIMLWRNSRAVIIGSNQNAVEEIDTDYVHERQIAVVRRQSGGGAVFHDLGNINFTVIHKYNDADFGGYAAFTEPVRAYLKTLGIEAELSGRNDLVTDGKKFCGNAQAVKNGRIMHHGCILFNADFADLSLSLRPKAEKIESKGVKSVKSRVTNLSQYLLTPMTPEEFMDGLGRYFQDNVKGIKNYELTPSDISAARVLTDEKYSKWEWNFGRSPVYNWQNSKRFDFGTVDARLCVKNGIIDDIVLYGDFFGVLDKTALEDKLRGIRHERSSIERALEDIDISQFIFGMTTASLVDLL